jgi:nitrogen fixation/metabolism regulation signal transduction histidine kinase
MTTFLRHLILTLAATLLTAFLALHHAWVWAAVALVAWGVIVWKFYLSYTRHIRRIHFLLDAVENDDYAIRFPVTSLRSTRDDDVANRLLNRIVQALSAVRSRAEQREKYYERILDVADTGILVLTPQGNVLQTNREVMRLLGMEVLTHVNQLQAVAPELHAALLQALPGEQRQVTAQVRLTERHFALRVSGITLQGEPLRIVALSDIRRELDDREIDTWIRLTRVLTHEIMNGLTPVTSLSQTLLGLPEADQPALRQGLQAIHSTGEGLLRFVESYRRLTRLPSPHPSLVNVRPFLLRQIQLAEEMATGGPRFLLTEAPDDLIMYADEGLMAQVVTNLLANAVQAGASEVTLRAFCAEDESIHLQVANDGPEIPAEVAEQIFVPFFTTKQEGSGIGLSLSKQIMRLSGGTLSLLPYQATRPLTVFEMVIG